jgi:heme-degrading monooxygenase HmoA
MRVHAAGTYPKRGRRRKLVEARARPIAHRCGEAAMIGVNVTFDYSGDFDRERVIKVAANARGMFEGMPGLRLKVFTLDQERQRAANFYVWDSEEAAKDFFTQDLRDRVTDLYGVAPDIEFVEIAEIVDNAHT